MPAPVQEYGAVPPFTSTVMVPFEALQVAGVAVAVAVRFWPCGTTTVTIAIQLLPSFTVTLYEPGCRFVIMNDGVVLVLLPEDGPLQLYV